MLRRIEMAVDAELDTVVDVADMDAILNDQTHLQGTRNYKSPRAEVKPAG